MPVRYWMQFGIFRKRLVNAVISFSKLVFYNVARKKTKVLLLTTDDLVIVKGNYFRLVWDIENCSRIKIDGYGTYSCRGQLIIKADFDQQVFKCWIYGYPRKTLRTINIKTISVQQKSNFQFGVAVPLIKTADRKTLPSYLRVAPKLNATKPTLNYRSYPQFREAELNLAMEKLSINLQTLTHYET